MSVFSVTRKGCAEFIAFCRTLRRCNEVTSEFRGYPWPLANALSGNGSLFRDPSSSFYVKATAFQQGPLFDYLGGRWRKKEIPFKDEPSAPLDWRETRDRRMMKVLLKSSHSFLLSPAITDINANEEKGRKETPLEPPSVLSRHRNSTAISPSWFMPPKDGHKNSDVLGAKRLEAWNGATKSQ